MRPVISERFVSISDFCLKVVATAVDSDFGVTILKLDAVSVFFASLSLEYLFTELTLGFNSCAEILE